MKITSIKKRKNHMYSIWSYPDLVAMLDADTIAKAGLREGVEISEEELDDLKEKSLFHCAKERALGLLSRREHSRYEIVNKLKNYYEPDLAQAVAENLTKAGLLDDSRFAQLYAQELIEKKYYAPARVERELRTRGIDRETAGAVLDTIEADPQERITAYLDRRCYGKLNTDREVKHAFSTLYRLGWRSDQLKHVLREYMEKNGIATQIGGSDES